MTPLQQAALDYLEAGLRILALTGKRPNGRAHGDSWSWDDSFHGAAETAEEIEFVVGAFSEERGTTGIAILIPEDFLVADVDTDEAAQLLIDLGWERNEDDVVSITKNGLHVWFYAPGQKSNRWAGKRSLLFKGLGGYVVAPPSLHFDAEGAVDGSYEWGTPFLSADGVRILPNILPIGVRDLFAMEDQFVNTKPATMPMTTFTTPYVEGLSWWQWPKVWDYNMSGLETAIERAAEGNQNNIIHWAACVCRDEGVPLVVCMERLLEAAIRGGHPRTRARDTIKGAYRAKPRG